MSRRPPVSRRTDTLFPCTTRVRAADLVMPDVARIGGVTGWQQAAAIAAVHGIEMSSHLLPEISSHLMSATPTAHWLEYVDWANALLAEPFEIRDRSEEHTSELQSLMRISYVVFCLKKKNTYY